MHSSTSRRFPRIFPASFCRSLPYFCESSSIACSDRLKNSSMIPLSSISAPPCIAVSTLSERLCRFSVLTYSVRFLPGILQTFFTRFARSLLAWTRAPRCATCSRYHGARRISAQAPSPGSLLAKIQESRRDCSNPAGSVHQIHDQLFSCFFQISSSQRPASHGQT